MNKHYEHIRKICIAKNPSILDLAMGCEVQRFSGITDTLLYIEAYGKGVSYTVRKGIDGMLFSEKTTNDVIENWVILGRPITLQDVLFALKSYSPNVHLMLRDDEEGLSIAMMGSDWIKYDLSKPLSEQSDEVLEWLSKQLTK